MRVKLISYNIVHGTYIEEVIDFLRSESPDVVCLQETGQKGRGLEATEDNIFDRVKNELGYEGVYAPTFGKKETNGVWQMGVAIMSHKKVFNERILPYAGGYKEFSEDVDFRFIWPSSLLVATVEGIPVPIATTHLPVTRETQVTERQLSAAREVKEFLKDEGRYILCGDMNTLPHSGTYEVLAEGLTDVTNHSLQTLHPTIHRAGSFGYHVDYVFYKGEGIECIKSEIPIIDASDHLPIVTEFQIHA